MAFGTFPISRAWQGLDCVISYVDFYGKHPVTGAAKTYHWSTLDHAGQVWLDGRLESAGTCTRQLSSRGGVPQGSPFTIRLADEDHTLRGFLANYNQKYWPRIEVVVNIIRAFDLQAGNAATTTQRGLIDDYSWDETSVSITVIDQISTGQDGLVPARKFESNWFVANLGEIEPIVCGGVSHADIFDPTKNGAIEPIYVGDTTVYNVSGEPDNFLNCAIFIIASHALVQPLLTGLNLNLDGIATSGPITGVGATYMAIIPGYYYWATFLGSNWYFANDYTGPQAFVGANSLYWDIQGTDGRVRRYTPMLIPYAGTASNLPIGVDASFVIANQIRSGQKKITLDVRGPETVGDGTGTEITNITDLFIWFARNFGERSDGGYQTGDYAASVETWADGTPKVDEASASSADRGFVGGYVFNAPITKRDAYAKFARSGFFDIGVNRKAQVICSQLSSGLSPTFTMRESKDLGALTAEGRVNREFANVFVFNWESRFAQFNTEFRQQTRYVDDTSVANHGNVQKECEALDLDFIHDGATVSAIAGLYINKYAKTPHIYSFSGIALHAFDIADLGSVGKFYHRGLIQSPMYGRVEGFTLNGDDPSVTLEVRDLRVLPLDWEEGMAVTDILGNPDQGYYDDDADNIMYFPGRRTFRVDHGAIPAGYVKRVRWKGFILGTCLYTPQVWNATSAAEAVAGTQITSTTYPANGSEQVLLLPGNTGVKYYEIRGKTVSGSDVSNLGFADILVETVVSGAP